MAAKKKSSINWSACKAAVRDWPQAGFVALLQELYDLSEDNRRFLHARLLPEESPQVLDEAKRKLKTLLSVQTVFNERFRHADVKRFIDQFAKPADPVDVADLLVTDLEIGFATFSEVGDFEPMVDHLYSTLARLDKVLADLPPGELPPLAARLDDLAERWGSTFGYGISDELSSFAEDWRNRVGPPPA